MNGREELVTKVADDHDNEHLPMIIEERRL